MTYDLDTNGCLILRADAKEVERLKEIRGERTTDGTNERPLVDMEYEALEPLLNNSDLEWIRPEEIGALTSAPILGFCERDAHGDILSVRAAWGFMDYAVRSFVDDLIETGKAVFTS